MATSTSNKYSPKVQITLDFLAAFTAFDVTKAETYLSKDFHHEFRPASLDGKTRATTEFFEFAQTITPVLKNFKVSFNLFFKYFCHRLYF